jgi:hypothetical protein
VFRRKRPPITEQRRKELQAAVRPFVEHLRRFTRLLQGSKSTYPSAGPAGDPESRTWLVWVPIPVKWLLLCPDAILDWLLGFQSSEPSTPTRPGRKRSDALWINEALAARTRGESYSAILKIPSVWRERRRRVIQKGIKPNQAWKAMKSTLRKRIENKNGGPN